MTPARGTTAARKTGPLTPPSLLEPEIDQILAEGQAAPGHIFNLGHGVPPDADPEVLHRIVKYFQAKSAHVPA
jgi:uroporphyrinogen decarboxylase